DIFLTPVRLLEAAPLLVAGWARFHQSHAAFLIADVETAVRCADRTASLGRNGRIGPLDFAGLEIQTAQAVSVGAVSAVEGFADQDYTAKAVAQVLIVVNLLSRHALALGAQPQQGAAVRPRVGGSCEDAAFVKDGSR